MNSIESIRNNAMIALSFNADKASQFLTIPFMSDEWISETEVADASLVILVGLVKPETIYEEALHFQKESFTPWK